MFLAKPSNHAVFNVVDLAMHDRTALFRASVSAIAGATSAVRPAAPHWIIVDEVHQFLPPPGPGPRSRCQPQDVWSVDDHGVSRPCRIICAFVADLAIVLGPNPSTTLGPIGRSAGKRPPRKDVSRGPAARRGSGMARWQPIAHCASRSLHLDLSAGVTGRNTAEGEIVDYSQLLLPGPRGEDEPAGAQSIPCSCRLPRASTPRRGCFHLRQARLLAMVPGGHQRRGTRRGVRHSSKRTTGFRPARAAFAFVWLSPTVTLHRMIPPFSIRSDVRRCVSTAQEPINDCVRRRSCNKFKYSVAGNEPPTIAKQCEADL
jgi:hypothetical protein